MFAMYIEYLLCSFLGFFYFSCFNQCDHTLVRVNRLQHVVRASEPHQVAGSRGGQLLPNSECTDLGLEEGHCFFYSVEDPPPLVVTGFVPILFLSQSLIGDAEEELNFTLRELQLRAGWAPVFRKRHR